MTEARELGPGDRVGFVGLGNMGAPMATRLCAAGFHVVGHDLAPLTPAQLVAAPGFSRARALAEVADGTAAVVLMLPNSAAVDAVLVHEGLLAVMTPGTIVIDMSSSNPAETQRLAALAEQRGVRLIDAPVSGGVPAARDGSLTIMVGGPNAWKDDVSAVLSTIGSHVVTAGQVGAGHALKAINNLLSASSLLASSEALEIGLRFGLDPQIMVDVVNQSSGRSWSTIAKWPRHILPGTYDSGFLLSLLLKDARIAVELARETGTAIPYLDYTLETWEKAHAELPPDADHTDIHRWVRSHTTQPSE